MSPFFGAMNSASLLINGRGVLQTCFEQANALSECRKQLLISYALESHVALFLAKWEILRLALLFRG